MIVSEYEEDERLSVLNTTGVSATTGSFDNLSLEELGHADSTKIEAEGIHCGEKSTTASNSPTKTSRSQSERSPSTSNSPKRKIDSSNDPSEIHHDNLDAVFSLEDGESKSDITEERLPRRRKHQLPSLSENIVISDYNSEAGSLRQPDHDAVTDEIPTYNEDVDGKSALMMNLTPRNRSETILTPRMRSDTPLTPRMRSGTLSPRMRSDSETSSITEDPAAKTSDEVRVTAASKALNSSSGGVDEFNLELDIDEVARQRTFSKPTTPTTPIMVTRHPSSFTLFMPRSRAASAVSPCVEKIKGQSEWTPPCLIEAAEFRRRTLFREGESSLWKADIVNAEDLSLGVLLYFEFARSACICLFVLSILSIPAIIISAAGSRIAIADRDAMGFAQFTIGNIGYDPKSNTYKQDSTCKHESSNYNGTCIDVFGGEMRFADAEAVLTAFEFLQIVAFFCFIGYLSWKSRSLIRHSREDECKVEDYAIMCRRLPKDTTTLELTTHFDQLYPLNKHDWLKRDPIARTRVVQKCENSGESIFIGTWIADCVIFNAIGKGLSAFKAHEDWTIHLLRSRALVDMYSPGTKHKKGPNPKKKLLAEEELYKVNKKIEKLTENLNKQKEILTDAQPLASEIESQSGNNLNVTDVVAGFITFEYSECRNRCVEDYKYYNSFPRNLLFYPPKLLFKGKRIKVEKAPDPGEVIWEHLEISGFSKRMRRTVTLIFSAILLIISFAAILQASIYKGKFAAKIPPGSLCNKIIPSMFGAYTNQTNYNDFMIIRPNSTDSTTELDMTCSKFIPGSFYGVYSTEYSIENTVSNYDFQACNTSLSSSNFFYRPSAVSTAPVVAGGSCPNYGQKTFCPCISKKSTALCSSSGCSIPGASRSCVTYPANSLDSCYCQQVLNNYLKKGVAATLNYLRTLATNPTADSCSVFFSDYSSAQSVSYGTILISIIINTSVLILMQRLSTFEAHVSVDRENATLMMKVFLFTYVNMAFTVLIAFGQISNLPYWIRLIYIFQGQYSDFSSEWYTNTGVYLLTSYFLKAVIDTITKLVMYKIVVPFRRYLVYPSIKKLSSQSIVTQYELNELEVGPLFDSSINNAHFVSMLFFSMTYASGLPLLMPMAFVALTVLFHVDRLLLLRFNRKPPHMGASIMKIILKALPFAAIIRLSFACWMYGYSGIFDSNVSKSTYSEFYKNWVMATKSNYGNYLTKNPTLGGSGDGSQGGMYFIVDRVFRPNVFPLLFLLAFIIFLTMIQLFWKFLPFFWIEQMIDYSLDVFQRLKRWRCGQKKVHVDAVEMSFRVSDIRVLRIGNTPIRHSAPFTGEYFCHLPKAYSIDGSSKFAGCCGCDGGVPLVNISRRSKIAAMNEMKDGWLFIDSTEVEGKNSKSNEIGCAYKVKKWTYPSHANGVEREAGDPKMTYEVIQDSGCSSYSLDKIPGYMMAIKGLKEGHSLVNTPKKPTLPPF